MKTKTILKTVLLACISLMSTNAKAYDGVFRKITSVDQLTTGYYVIVGSEDATNNPDYAMGTSITTGGNNGTSISFVDVAKKLIKNPTDELVWHIEVNNNTISLYNISERAYLFNNGTTPPSLSFYSEKKDITLEGYKTESPKGFMFSMGGTTTTYLKYYNHNNKHRFENSTETTYTKIMTPLRLYKKVEFNEGMTTVEDINCNFTTLTMTRNMNSNKWNTFCAPFAMSAEQITTNFGAGAEVMELTGLTVSDDNYNMTFTSASSIDKNTPYMVKPTMDVSSITVNNADVVIDNSSLPQKTVTDNNGHSVTFHGNYAKGLVPRGAYFISGGNFYLADSDVTLKGYRGYITIDGAAAKEVTYSFSDTDGIKSVSTAATDNKAYNLAGQRVDANTKGIIIVNGRKVINK